MPFIIFTITVLNSVYIYVSYNKVSFIFLFSLSNAVSLVNLANVLRCFLIKSFLLIGQTSVFNTVDISCLFPYLAAHTQIIGGLLFGPWCH